MSYLEDQMKQRLPVIRGAVDERHYTNRSRGSNTHSPPSQMGKLKPREGLSELTELGGPEVVTGHSE